MSVRYEGMVIRPPSEAESLIVQVTLGCSDNGCSFCPAYKLKKFRVKGISEIKRDFAEAARLFPDTRRLFLADGDAMVIARDELIGIMEAASAVFPKLARIGVYASPKSLAPKTIHDLEELKKRKLSIVYLGVETGDPSVYRDIKKWGSPEETVKECLKVKEAGITLNATVIIGLGGKERTHENAVGTAKVLNAIKPDHVAALTLMAVPGTEIHKRIERGELTQLDSVGTVREIHELVTNLGDLRCQFFSDHASNYYSIRARFPRDKEAVLESLSGVIKAGRSSLRPEWMRGL